MKIESRRRRLLAKCADALAANREADGDPGHAENLRRYSLMNYWGNMTMEELYYIFCQRGQKWSDLYRIPLLSILKRTDSLNLQRGPKIAPWKADIYSFGFPCTAEDSRIKIKEPDLFAFLGLKFESSPSESVDDCQSGRAIFRSQRVGVFEH